MTIDHAKELNRLCSDGLWMAAGTRICQILEHDHIISNNAEGLKVVQDLLQHLLDNDMYLEAATLQWGPDQFNTEPESTVRVFKAMQDGSTVLLMGASSLSKSYAAGAYMLLDYLRDPFYTTIKLAAVNEDHLRKNLFAHVVNLFRSCAVPSTYDITVQDSSLWMGIKAAGFGFGISGIAFKQSQETSGQFKGYKAQPVRKKKHDKFGYLSRLRVLGDECLPYWQRVKMADGSEMQIGEIVNKKLTANVLSINNLTGKIESKKITGWHAVPRRGRKIVGVKSGDNLAFVTEDHPILTNKGYVSALEAANCGLSVATLNENISCNQNTIKGTEVHNHWWASWGRINLSKLGTNRKITTDPQDDEIVYCIDVEDNHNFFAGGIAVKNCQNWPSGPFKDFNSLVASKSGTELIKIACAFNPETTSVHVVQLAEPEHGWSVDDMDSLYDWNSKAGWRVCRLDAALCENVKQRKVIYPGLQTYEGFISYLKAGGDNSPNYSCFARGWPPMKGDVNTIIPPQWPQESRGEATFIENPEVFAAVDLAFMGKDSAQMAIGRWGLASGWEDHMGRFQPFKDRLNSAKDKPRHVLQIDQLIPLEKHDNTVQMAEEIMGRCKMLRIEPDHVAVDKTGYGFGTWSHLCKVWGEVLGIAWNEKASELKILAEDQNGADKQCDGIMSEMWWAFRRWLDPSCRAILINPIIPPQPLHTQLTSRRYRTGAKGIKVEAKEEYKSRNQASPDEADSCFVAGTLVSTPNGLRKIETLSIGDEVITPFGITKIAKVHVTETNALAKLQSSDGKVLIGKPSHKVFTWNRGWVRMDSLVLTDQLEPVNDIGSWKIINSLFTTKKCTVFKLLVDIIKTKTRLRRRDFYIELSGLSGTGLFLKGCTFITKMATGWIIPKKTSSSCPRPNTHAITWPHLGMIQSGLKELGADKKMPLNLQCIGIGPQKDLLGTQNTQSSHGRAGSQEAAFASNAVGGIPHLLQNESEHVQLHAKTNGGIKNSKRKSVNALFAGVLLLLKSAVRKKPAPESVVLFSVTNPEKTYNLTLEDHNVYYANGLLVDNCIMLVHLIRQTSDVIPGLVEHQNNRPQEGKSHIKLYSMKNYVNVEADDSISNDGADES